MDAPPGVFKLSYLLPEDAQHELPALRCMYNTGPEEVVTLRPPPAGSSALPCIAVALRPNAPPPHFVAATLVFSLSPAYPHVSPAMSLEDVRGLGDARQARLLQALAQRAQQEVGEMALMVTVETARELLDEQNHPEGSCAFWCARTW